MAQVGLRHSQNQSGPRHAYGGHGRVTGASDVTASLASQDASSLGLLDPLSIVSGGSDASQNAIK